MVRSVEKLNTAEDLSMIAATLKEDGISEGVQGAIGELSPSSRELVYLRYYDGMTHENISAVLGISEQAINGRLRRAKKKIADYLRRNGFAEV